jgi:hypothetical protein
VAASAARAQAGFAQRADRLRPDTARAANDALVDALTQISRGYRELARAARAQDAVRYRAAGAVLRLAHADLAHAITDLKLLAYQVQRGA